MKTIFSLILFFTVQLFSQGWNNTITTNVNEPNLVKMDLFTNKDGNHIIVQNSNSTNSIKYYLLNSSGSVVRSSTIETAGNASFPNVSGDNGKVYLVYKLGTNLKVRRSTNAGQSWLSDINNLSIGSNTCSGLDIVYDYQGLHVVYAIKASDPNYETYYYRINSGGSWVDYKNVTDYFDEVGGQPSVASSPEKVYVSYNTSVGSYIGLAKVRERNSGGWEIPETVMEWPLQSIFEKLAVRNNKLFLIWEKYYVIYPVQYADLMYQTRDLDEKDWTEPMLIEQDVWPDDQPFDMKLTRNENLNLLYKDFGLNYRYFNGSNWTDAEVIDNSNDYVIGLSIANTSNDIFLAWRIYGNSYLKYKQYDATPLAPQNLAVTNSASNHPLLSWTKNNEPDVSYYIVEKYLGEEGWQPIAQTTNLYYEDPTEHFCTAIPPDICDSGHDVQYRVKAFDYHSYTSSPSDVVVAHVTGQNPYKIGIGSMPLQIPDKHSLEQNYPNPFNPTTLIRYQIPTASFVSIKVFDVLGNEVAVLVNEVKPEGFYEVEFNAANLPSGIYIYKMEAEKFNKVNKMILVR